VLSCCVVEAKAPEQRAYASRSGPDGADIAKVGATTRDEGWPCSYTRPISAGTVPLGRLRWREGRLLIAAGRIPGRNSSRCPWGASVAVIGRDRRRGACPRGRLRGCGAKCEGREVRSAYPALPQNLLSGSRRNEQRTTDSVGQTTGWSRRMKRWSWRLAAAVIGISAVAIASPALASVVAATSTQTVTNSGCTVTVNAPVVITGHNSPTGSFTQAAGTVRCVQTRRSPGP
jgi:hypothetical protein